MTYPQRRFDEPTFFYTGHPSLPLQCEDVFVHSAPGLYNTPVPLYPKSDCYQAAVTSAPESIYEQTQTEYETLPSWTTACLATNRSLPAPTIYMDGSFHLFETHFPTESFDGSPFAFQRSAATMACPPPFQVSHSSHFTCPLETAWRSYHPDVTGRTPTPSGSTASSLSSQDGNVWDTCCSTAMSPSSSFDGSVPGSSFTSGPRAGEMTDPSSNRRVVTQPAAIDAAENIWEVDELLGKWTRGGTTWYYVKWKGFDDEHNTWEKRNNISADLIAEFEATYEGNNFAIQRLLEKRTRRWRTEYLVQWKGPDSETTWEKGADISRTRIMEFEGSFN